MLRSSLEKDVEVAVPLVGIGGGETVDEVEAEVVETSLFGPTDTLAGMFGIVAAAEIIQIVVEETLYADAEPVDAQFAQGRKVINRQGVGVGFEGDLGVGFNFVMIFDEHQQVADFFCAEQ